MRTVDIGLLPGGQSDFALDLSSPYKALVGGLGSGKTKSAVAASLILGSVNAPIAGVFVEPTYSLVKDVALPAFEELLDEHGLPYDWHSSDQVLVVGRGRSQFPVMMRSGDKPHRFVGFNAAWGMIDEPGQQKRDIFKRVVQRCRHPLARVRQVGLTGSPEGLNWFYDVCELRPPPGMRVYRAKTTDNPFLPDGYLDSLLSTLTHQEVQSYAEGKFVNLTSGAVYPSFDRKVHGAICLNPFAGQLVVGADFNVGKMCWVIGRRLGEELHIFDELVVPNTNTYRQADALVDRLVDLVSMYLPRHDGSIDAVIRSVRVHTDATGSARKTAATASDMQIIMGKGFAVYSALSNPAVRDRVYSVEQKLRPSRSTGMPTLYVDPRRCPELVRSLEGQPWGKDGAPEKKRGNEDLSGPVDALGYAVWGFDDWRATVPTGNRVGAQSYL